MKALVVVLAFIPALALGSGVRRDAGRSMALLFTANQAAAGGTPTCPTSRCWYHALPAGASVTVLHLTMSVTAASGGGAGTTVHRVTDGTSVCDCATACTSTQSTGGKIVACSGACTFAGGTVLTVTNQSSTCTSTQPTVGIFTLLGKWN